MPRENVERAIKKASGSDAQSYMEVTYEGYGPYGIAIFIECTTDNINRTVADVRAIFNKYNGELGKNGSLEFLFEKKGVFIIEKSALNLDLEELEMELIDFGLEEFEIHDEICNILCDFDKFGVMQEKLTSMSIDVKSAEVERLPNELKDLGLDQALKIFNIIEKFEENDDVQKVFHNLHVSDNIIKELDK